MALVFVEGFEQYGDGVDFKRGPFTQNSSGANPTFMAGRNGGQALLMSAVNQGQDLALPGTHVDELFVGMAYQWTGGSMQAHDVLGFLSNGGENIQLQVTAAGELEVRRSSTQLEITSGLGLTNGQWYYIQMYALIHPSAGAYEVRVNNVTQLMDSGIDTEGTGGSLVTTLRFMQQSSSDPSIDDLYVLDTTGLVNNTWLGNVYVETVFPMGDGNRNDMTRVGGGLNNYEAVDDGSTPDDDTTYVHGNVVGDDELYDFDDLVGGDGGFEITQVHGVAVTNHYRKADAGSRSCRALARSVATEVEGTEQGCNVEYRYYQQIYEDDPDTAAAWADADAVNAAEFGITIEA